MTRLLLFTDEPVLAQGLQALLTGETDLQFLGVCQTTTELFHELETGQPDVLLMDLTPDLTFSVLIEVQRRSPNCKSVLWVRSISTELAYQAIEHGVRGIVRRTHPPETLTKCLRLVAEGGLWFEEALKASFHTVRTVSLTKRESQLVSLLAQGLKNKEIASSLFISEGTVKVYLSRLFHKLGVKDRFELALYGLRNMPIGEGPVELPHLHPAQPKKKDVAQAQWLRSLVMERPQARVRGDGTTY